MMGEWFLNSILSPGENNRKPVYENRLLHNMEGRQNNKFKAGVDAQKKHVFEKNFKCS